MNLSDFFNQLVATGHPLLPDPALMRLNLQLGWASVLGVTAFWAGRTLSAKLRLGVSLLMVLWALLPGSASPNYWLGLAFQGPSLMSVVLCWVWVFRAIRPMPKSMDDPSGTSKSGLKIALSLGIALGWVLLSDTLAWWPVSVYSWGFSVAATAAVVCLAVFVWALEAGGSSCKKRNSGSFLIVTGVMALFVLTRLPTGNVWDALLDPWLWVAFQVSVVRVGLLRWRGRQAG